MLEETIPASESIAELQAQLQQFRSTRAPQTRLPQSVWQSAADLARRHGIYVVARSLRLDCSTLKKQVKGSGTSSAHARKKSQPQFVELIGGARESVDEYAIEFASRRGSNLRIL